LDNIKFNFYLILKMARTNGYFNNIEANNISLVEGPTGGPPEISLNGLRIENETSGFATTLTTGSNVADYNIVFPEVGPSLGNDLLAVDDPGTGLLKWVSPSSSTLNVINSNTINNTNDINTDTLAVGGTGTFNNIDVAGPVVCGVVQSGSVVSTNVTTDILTVNTTANSNGTTNLNGATNTNGISNVSGNISNPAGLSSSNTLDVTTTSTFGGNITANGGVTSTSTVTAPLLSLEKGGQTVGLEGSNPAGNIIMTLPSTVGNSGQVLTSDGAGNLNWQANLNGDQFELIKFTFQTNLNRNKGNSENVLKYFLPVPLTVFVGYMYKIEVQFKFARTDSGSNNTDFEFNYDSPNTPNITSYPYGAIVNSFSSLYSTQRPSNQSFTHSAIFETNLDTTYHPSYQMRTGPSFSAGTNGGWTESYFCKITRIPLTSIPN
jgi:hypothetical protein